MHVGGMGSFPGLSGLSPYASPMPRMAPGSQPPELDSHSADQVQLNPVAHQDQPEPARFLALPDGRKLALPERGRFVMGRTREAQVRLDGDLVSRQHCQGEFRNGQLWLMDTSSNGTFVNGKELPHQQWAEIPPGADIGFGQAVHTFKLGKAEPLASAVQAWEGPEGQKFHWPDDQEMVKVGRSDDSHFRLGDSLVSSHHALMRKRDGKTFVLDLSRNGTFLNGERLPAQTWTEVKPGHQLAFGDPALGWSTGR